MRYTWLARPVLLGCGLLTVGNTSLWGGDETAPVDRPAVAFTTLQPGDSGPILLTGATESTPGTPDPVQVLAEGTSDRDARKSARARLPLTRMHPVNRQRVMAVLEDISMFRAMPTIRMAVDHDVYRFFVDHPDVAVSSWRALEVSQCQLWQTGPDSYETEIGDGSFGAIDVLYRGPNDQVVIGEGKFKSPLLINPIEAVGVMHLQTQFITRADGETEAICRASLFVTFPSQTIETAAKVISPLTNMVIDRNFQEVGLYAHVMTMAMRNQPGWVENLAGQLDGILESSRKDFLEVTAKAYVAHRNRELSRNGRSFRSDQLLQTAGQKVAPPEQ